MKTESHKKYVAQNMEELYKPEVYSHIASFVKHLTTFTFMHIL